MAIVNEFGFSKKQICIVFDELDTLYVLENGGLPYILTSHTADSIRPLAIAFITGEKLNMLYDLSNDELERFFEVMFAEAGRLGGDEIYQFINQKNSLTYGDVLAILVDERVYREKYNIVIKDKEEHLELH